MQSGTIKKWHQDKGYGFIEVDNQSEDVFFHASKVQLSQPIAVGQRVYFDCKRNDKNQLRATKVRSNPDKDSSAINPSSSRSSKHPRHNRDNYTSKQSINNWAATVFSTLGLLAIIYFGFIELKPKFFSEEVSSNAPAATLANEATVRAITGDTQIDNTIALIQQGGPFPYPNKDGTTFYNREGKLPAQPQGYYHEYTVPTLGASDRGSRRIVTGGNPPTIYYFTADHYSSFTTLNVGSK